MLVNEVVLGQFVLDTDEWYELTFEVANEIIRKDKGVLATKLKVDTMWKPAEVFRNADTRILGVGVRKIAWKARG